MNFERPSEAQITTRKQDVSVSEGNTKKRSSKEHVLAAAVVGALAISDAQASNPAEEHVPNPTVKIKYEAAPTSAASPLRADKDGRFSLPAAKIISQSEQGPGGASDEKSIQESGGTEEKLGRTVLFSEYQAGKVPSADPTIVEEEYRERIDRLKEASALDLDLRTPDEKKVEELVSKTEKALGTQEAVAWTQEQIRGFLSRIAQLTGADPTGAIQKVGDFVVLGSSVLADAVLTDRIRAMAIRSMKDENMRQANQVGGAAISQGELRNAALEFDTSHMNARNMLLQHTLGSTSGGWEVTFGADPGLGISKIVKGNSDPAVGVVFRLKLP